MTIPPLAEVPVRSSLALTRRWAALFSPLFFDSRSLWLTWLGPDGRQAPALLPVDDVPARPDHRLLRGLLDLHDGVTSGQLEGGHLAMALCRPGPPVEDAEDTDWVFALHDLFDEQIDGTWSLHLAAGGRVEPLVEAPNFFAALGWATAGVTGRSAR
ncbi:hypothetical protein DQ238_08145 [Geodermatophilus sp. TF02-6]|uniref:hypothetical protein n=1 Tax=Geodermatophilus sp. TF02-6 TaxID=2250575 RepID=UPI000DE87B80|nr:hypothetical protein [Geodermatophilus sp. TF02-6]RBY80548.1 hypothetical protein DQ238_08145 [Geodermatophilus sp. TF02-6]